MVLMLRQASAPSSLAAAESGPPSFAGAEEVVEVRTDSLRRENDRRER
jgi:hypothetical protein